MNIIPKTILIAAAGVMPLMSFAAVGDYVYDFERSYPNMDEGAADGSNAGWSDYNWNDSSVWTKKPDGRDTPGENDNVLLHGQHTKPFFAQGSTATVKNLVIDTLWDAQFRPYETGASQDHASYNPASLVVKENFEMIFGNGTGADFGDSNGSRGFKYLEVGGNFSIKAGGSVSSGPNGSRMVWSPRENYSRTNLSMLVRGSVNLDNVRWCTNASGTGDNDNGYSVDAFIQIGGLNSSGYVSIGNNDKAANSTTLIFKGSDANSFQGGDFTGGFYGYWTSGKTMNLIMDGENGGKQTIHLRGKTYSADGDAVLNVTVESGMLEMGSATDGQKINSLTLQGGKFSLASERFVKVQNLVLDGGELLFVASDGAVDYIEADAISGDKSTQVFIDLAMSDFGVGDSLDGRTFEIIRGATDTDGLSVAFVYNGVEQSFVWSWQGGTVNVESGTIAVPEPAALAAIFGALALALAFGRRRK